MKAPILVSTLANISKYTANHLPRLGFVDKSRIDISSLKPLYLDREKMEKDPNYKQHIPYVVFKNGNKILSYRRAKGSGEQRLLGKRSIGFGGHVDQDPEADETTSVSDAVKEAAFREVKEELSIEIQPLNFLGFINDDTNEVGQVHLGHLFIAKLTHQEVDKILAQESEIEELEWLELTSDTVNPIVIESLGEDYELWSQVAYKSILEMELQDRSIHPPH